MAWASAVISSQDFQADIQFLSQSIAEFSTSPSITNAIGVLGDLAGLLAPGLSGGGGTAKSAVKGVKSFFRGPGDEIVESTSRAINTVDDAGRSFNVIDRSINKLDDVPLDGALTNVTNSKGWSVGDPINNLTKAGNIPSWSAVRQRIWKNEALYNASSYSTSNLARMSKGKAPLDGLGFGIELHHNPAQRFGGLFDVIGVTQEEHRAIDVFRK